MLISGIYKVRLKQNVNTRRVNREMKRSKLAYACFVPNPRLRKHDGSVKVAGVK